MLSKLCAKASAFLHDEDGPTAVEYAVMLALIVVVCIGTIAALGTNSNNTFKRVSTNLNSAS
jgi:pilus assembly protein Flp/PilA